MRKLLPLIFVLFAFLPLSSIAQQLSISGVVMSKEDNTPIAHADIYIEGSQMFTSSDNEGKFTLKLPKGKHTISSRMLGYVTTTMDIDIKGSVTGFVIELTKSSLEIDGVVVTAKALAQSKEGTSTYTIGTDAIKQVQAISLSDIMALLPGGQFSAVDLDGSLQTNLRSASSSSVNSFGTAVIVDGAPMSNDGNMQVVNGSSSLTAGSNVAGKGIDLREIQASNIESVEVVTGVASARYGNITSGAVLVTRKAGYMPLSVGFNSTPTTYQGNISQGFQLNNGSYLNLDGDYTFSNGSETEIKNYYQRVGISGRWTSTFSEELNWNNTLSFSYSHNGDGQREEPEETLTSKTDIQNHYINVGLNGSLDFLGKLNYTFNGSMADQYTSVETGVTDGNVPMIEPTETGTYFTTEFTNLIYTRKTEMIGKPVNLYARLEAVQHASWLNNQFDFMTGMEYTYDKNYGEGRVVGSDGVSSAGTPGGRSMLYNNIPASKNFSAYHQTNMSRSFDDFMYNLHFGVRYDNMLERYNLFSPRLSGSIGFLDQFRVNAAWGLSYKAPSMATLYPGPTYFDIVNYMDYATDPAERIAVVTTYVIDGDNTHLEPSKGDTKEITLEWDKNDYSLRLTGFLKTIDGGISSYTNLAILENQGYIVVDDPVGETPVLAADPDDVTYLARTYTTYENISRSESKGLELTFTPPHIESTHTGFNLSGQLIKTTSWDTEPEVKASNGSAMGIRYGVYDSYAYEITKATANATIIQQIPALRLMVTLTTEFNLYYRSQTIRPDIYAIGYYNQSGEYFAIDESDKASDDYADLQLSSTDIDPTIVPFYTNFHLNIRKETKKGHSFSFYATNCFWYNPYYTDKYTESTSRLNSEISFGFGFTLKL